MLKNPSPARRQAIIIALAALLPALLVTSVTAAGSVLVGWSDLGLRETDGSDLSVYSLMPPYHTIHAQLMVGGKLVTNAANVTVTYEAVADSAGSINSTSMGKGNFHQFAEALFGVALGPEEGLGGFAMPGLANQPQTMAFDAAQNWFTATGIPLTPYDDQGRKNYYPLMRLVARNGAGTSLASTDIVLPVTDEMDCRTCHASGSRPVARPNAGWAWDCDPDRDTRINILRNHDDHHGGSATYSNVLRQVGYNPAGLIATVVHDRNPILCVRCHTSNALPGTGTAGMRPLTEVMHMKHAYVLDPALDVPLITAGDSAACLRCHAGPDSRRLRGVHHNPVNVDGTRALQCQSCHGKMTELGRPGRQGWLDEPNCQSCHTGTATRNNGQLRYTSAFDGPGQVRQAVDRTFATEANTPAAGLSLYRYSEGHGGLKCEACHGSSHAEFPSLQPNDNTQNRTLQGSSGALLNCNVCHPTTPNPLTGGPHGMHPINQSWASNHEDFSRTQCQTCHGADYRGTVLSRSQGDRTFDAKGTKHFWPGFQIGCYNCHNGPNSDDSINNLPATVSQLATNTVAEMPVTIGVSAVDPNGNALAFRIVSQPAHGTVSLDGRLATYYPAAGFVGNDSFTYAAWDGSTDSNLGTVNVNTRAGTCVLRVGATAPTAAVPDVPVPFGASAALTGCDGAIAYDWDFGDGTAHAFDTGPCHRYASPGDFAWKLTVTANGTTQMVTGVVTISATLGPLLHLAITPLDFTMLLSWPEDRIPTALETSSEPGNPDSWLPVTEPPVVDSTNWIVETFVFPGPQYFRLRRVP